ncbi:MAG: PEP-CTERM sorting domain-containing protein, partial [Gammaproteobacteria bacterium]
SFLINRPDQLNQAPYSDTTFIVDGGTSRFGVGLSNFQTFLNETDLVVNGVNFGHVSNLPNYVDGGPTIKNLYLLVSSETGDPLITTVKFDNLDTIDAHLFDHVAIDPSPVPLPSTLYLLGVGLAGLVGRATKRNGRVKRGNC